MAGERHGGDGSIAIAKQEVRRRLRRLRSDLDPERRHQEEAANQTALTTVLRARPAWPLAAFRALPGEAGVEGLLRERWHAGGRVWLPRVSAPGRLDWHPVSRPTECRIGSYGIEEPDPAQVPSQELPIPVLLCVPGCAFDAAGRRLGMGAGFYDRLMDRIHAGGGLSIGIAYRCQVVEQVPCEEHDRRVHAVCAGGDWVRPMPRP
ncbi:MAG: 5-formyltetrahydrofolate cyclo-ligase [Planctomycetota bacterium]